MIEGTVSPKCSQCNHCEVCQWVDLKMDGCDWFEEEPKTKWIPVSERLPEDKQSVLVWCPQYKNIYCAYLEKEQWWIFGAFVQIVPNEVVAWCELPEPYKASPTGEEVKE